MSNRRKLLLSKLLQAMIDEWGYSEVGRVLSELGAQPHSHRTSHDLFSTGRELERSRKSSAVEQVVRSNALDDKREPLLAIAVKFDNKAFLPSIADLKQFLVMMGTEVGRVKDRADGFRRLLPPLSDLPTERLRELASSSSFSGPAQLGPLSDAIASTGAAIRRHKKVSDSDC